VNTNQGGSSEEEDPLQPYAHILAEVIAQRETKMQREQLEAKIERGLSEMANSPNQELRLLAEILADPTFLGDNTWGYTDGTPGIDIINDICQKYRGFAASVFLARKKARAVIGMAVNPRSQLDPKLTAILTTLGSELGAYANLLQMVLRLMVESPIRLSTHYNPLESYPDTPDDLDGDGIDKVMNAASIRISTLFDRTTEYILAFWKRGSTAQDLAIMIASVIVGEEDSQLELSPEEISEREDVVDKIDDIIRAMKHGGPGDINPHGTDRDRAQAEGE